MKGDGSVDPIENLDNIHKDMLKEFGNIGAGNAATALSSMLSTKVEISVPSVEIVELAKIPMKFEDPEELVIGVAMKAEGDAEGTFLLVMDSKASKAMLSVLIGNAPESLTDIGEFEKSAFSEIGNIMCGSYLVALSNFTGLNFMGTPPVVLVDMISGILAEAAIQTFGEFLEDYVIFIDTDIIAETLGDGIKGMLIFIPKKGAMKKILEVMGMKIDG